MQVFNLAGRAFPWVIAAGMAVLTCTLLYKQVDTSVTLDHTIQQLAVVEQQRDALKILVESRAAGLTRRSVTSVLTSSGKTINEAPDHILAGPMRLRFDGERLVGIEFE